MTSNGHPEAPHGVPDRELDGAPGLALTPASRGLTPPCSGQAARILEMHGRPYPSGVPRDYHPLLMKLKVLLSVTSLLIAVIAALYFSGVIGCSLPKTKVAVRKAYDGPATLAASAEDWPKWRGPRGDGISREPLPDALPAGGLKQLWAADVGLGFSSPIAAGGRVYLFSMNEEKEVLTCFDAHSGRIIWNVEGGPGWRSSYSGTRATPAIDGQRIYTFGGHGDLVCRDLADGKQVWMVNVLAETGAGKIGWGQASSPLVAGDLVYVQGGKGGAVAMAVNKNSGQIAWKSQATGVGGYAHPVMADVAGAPQLIIFAGEFIFGMNPQTGATLWSYPWNTSYDVNAATPVYRDGKLLITSEYDHGCIQLALTPSSASKVWENKSILAKFQPPILDGDYLYANSAEDLVCVKWSDGSTAWKAKDIKLGAGGSLVRSGDKLITLSERGKLTLLKATPDGYTILGKADAVDGTQVWSSPLLYGGRLYAKGQQELICFTLFP